MIDNVQDLGSSVQYVAVAGQIVFPYPFPIFEDADLLVQQSTAAINLGTDYTVDGAGNDTGGNVILTAGATGGVLYTITRQVPIVRTTDFQQNGPYASAAINQELNRITIVEQQLKDAIGRALRIPVTSPASSASLELNPALFAGAYLTMDSNGNILPGIPVAGTLTRAALGTLLYPTTGAESAASVVPTDLSDSPWVYDVRRIGIVPNDISKAAANTAFLRALWNPAVTGPVGDFIFPNTTGNDTYFFNGNVAMRDGVRVNVMGCTLQFNITGTAADNQCGCLTAQRNVLIENGSLTWVFTQGSAASNFGNGLMFGGRGTDVGLFPAVYDSLLTTPMGNIVVRNMRLNGTASAAESRGVFMLGGLSGVVFENIWVEGNGALLNGGYYEFGYATNPTDASARQSSHMHNATFRNFNVNNVASSGLDGNGAYGVLFDGIKVTNTPNGMQWGVGEARFFRPRTGDQAGVKHGLAFRNLSLAPTAGNGLTVTGTSGTIGGGYLGPAWQANHAYILNSTVVNGGNLYTMTAASGTSAASGGPSGTTTGIVDNTCTWNYVSKAASTDLLDCLIEDFAIKGTDSGIGISLQGVTGAVIRYGSIVGCQSAIGGTSDTTRVGISDVAMLDSCRVAARFDTSTTSIYGTARKSTGYIRNCFIAGSGTVVAQSAAISLLNTVGWTVENNRFGYEAAHDDRAETTQGSALIAGANTVSVVCRGNYVAAISGGAIAWVLASGSGFSNGCKLEGNTGIVTTQGQWLTDYVSTSAQALSNSSTIAITGLRTIRVTAAAAVTGVILAAGTQDGQEVVVIHESVAANTITFAASGTSHVADGTSDIITGPSARRFVWDNATSLWYRQT